MTTSAEAAERPSRADAITAQRRIIASLAKRPHEFSPDRARLHRARMDNLTSYPRADDPDLDTITAAARAWMASTDARHDLPADWPDVAIVSARVWWNIACTHPELGDDTIYGRPALRLDIDERPLALIAADGLAYGTFAEQPGTVMVLRSQPVPVPPADMGTSPARDMHAELTNARHDPASAAQAVRVAIRTRAACGLPVPDFRRPER